MTTDIREMRKAVFGLGRGRRISDGSSGFFGAQFVHQARAWGDRDGLSGEDVMTIIAYHALKENERLSDLVLEAAQNTTAPLIVRAAEPPG